MKNRAAVELGKLRAKKDPESLKLAQRRGGLAGGRTNVEKRGLDYFVQIGKKGGAAKAQRWKARHKG